MTVDRPAPTLTRLGTYELLRPLAQGGMADIYLARRHGPGHFERHVAVKVLNQSRAHEPSPASSTIVITTLSSRGSRTSLRKIRFTSSRISSCNRTVRVPSPSSRSCDLDRCCCLVLPMTHVSRSSRARARARDTPRTNTPHHPVPPAASLRDDGYCAKDAEMAFFLLR